MYKLHEIGFERYRAFAEPQSIELKPITLLFGHNSAGKSAALRALPILAAAARSTSSSGSVLDYRSAALRDAVFQEVVSAGHPGSGLRFWLRWADAAVDLEIRELSRLEGERVSELFFTAHGHQVKAHLGGSEGEETYDLELDDRSDGVTWRMPKLRPVVQEGAGELQRLAETLTSHLDHFSNSVHWLGAVRSDVPRYVEIQGGVSYEIAPNGTGVAQVLLSSSIRGDGIATAVSAWLSKACGCELAFAETDMQVVFNRTMYPFNVRAFASPEAQIAVRDVGEGIAQALPVVTLCHQARAGTLGQNQIIVLEQPELHLHPKATVTLADEIVACATANNSNSHVIESHSESFLLGVQIALVEKRLRPDDVAIYWVSQIDGVSSINRIEIDDAGYPTSGWPEGVFRETLAQAQQLSRLRLA